MIMNEILDITAELHKYVCTKNTAGPPNTNLYLTAGVHFL